MPFPHSSVSLSSPSVDVSNLIVLIVGLTMLKPDYAGEEKEFLASVFAFIVRCPPTLFSRLSISYLRFMFSLRF